MTAPPPATHAERMRRAMAAASVGADDPVALLLTEVASIGDDLRRTPDPEAEDRMAQRVAAGITTRVEAALVRRGRLLELPGLLGAGAALVTVVALAFGGGWYAGQAQPVPSAQGPMSRDVLQVLRLNDMAAALEQGERVPQRGGGEARRVLLWTEAPSPALARR